MSKYTCEKCGREFKQKGHYTTHLNKKNPCVNELKIKEIVDKAVEEKISKIKNNIIFDIVEDETIIEPFEPEDTKSSKTNIIETKNAKVVREEGLDKFLLGGYDLVLLDIMLPKVDGLEILRKAKQTPPKKGNGPIVLLTNLGQDSIIKEGFTLGAAGYLIKSAMNPDQVLNEVKVFLNKGSTPK